MLKNRVINLSIVVLAALAVLQTGSLWLGQTKGPDHIYSAFNGLISSGRASGEDYIPIKAESCAVGIGANKYILCSLKEGSFSSTIETVLGSIISEGVPSEILPLDWNAFTEESVILTYPFSVSSVEFAKGFSSKSSTIELDNFNYIVITPSFDGETVSASFISTAEHSLCVLTLKDETVTTALKDEISKTGDGLVYISSAQSGFNIFKNNVFLPQWTTSEYSYHPIRAVLSGCDENGILSTSSIKQMVQPFFEPYSPDVTNIDSAGVHLFYTDEVVVKYYPDGIMEYFNYEKSNQSQTLASAYDACISFLEKDSSINTDIYLSSAEATTEGLVFKFNYSVNNIPVILGDAGGIENAIEVVVNGNSVKKYRKYACNFYNTEEDVLFANVDFSTEINRVITEYAESGQAILVDDMTICYYYNGSELCPLKWQTSLGDKTFIGETFVQNEDGGDEQ